MNTKPTTKPAADADSGTSNLDIEFVIYDLKEVSSTVYLLSCNPDAGEHETRALSGLSKTLDGHIAKLEKFHAGLLQKKAPKGGAS